MHLLHAKQGLSQTIWKKEFDGEREEITAAYSWQRLGEEGNHEQDKLEVVLELLLSYLELQDL